MRVYRTTLVAVILLSSTQILSGDAGSSPTNEEQVIKVTAKQFEYSPNVITVRLNVPVMIELITLDRTHGFAVPDLKVEGEVKPGQVTRIRFTPDRLGTFPFHCNHFCGSGHEDMTGEIVVTK